MQSTSPNSSFPAIGRLSTLLAASALVATASSDAAARPPSGGYFGFGVGYALVAGEKGVDLRTGIPGNILGGSEAYRDIVRTEFGEGLGFELRFGWLFGPVAAEIGLVGHGTFDFKNGAGYPLFTVRFHPLLLVDSLIDLPFDFNVFVGAGYAIGGYRHEIGNDDKGWEGWAPTTGLGLSYDLSASVRLGLDLRFVLPQYRTFLYDWDDDIEFKSEDIPKTVVFIPSLQIIASF
jgi:hypothetical protein